MQFVNQLHSLSQELLYKFMFGLRVEKGGVFEDEVVTYESFQAHFGKLRHQGDCMLN